MGARTKQTARKAYGATHGVGVQTASRTVGGRTKQTAGKSYGAAHGAGVQTASRTVGGRTKQTAGKSYGAAHGAGVQTASRTVGGRTKQTAGKSSGAAHGAGVQTASCTMGARTKQPAVKRPRIGNAAERGAVARAGVHATNTTLVYDRRGPLGGEASAKEHGGSGRSGTAGFPWWRNANLPGASTDWNKERSSGGALRGATGVQLQPGSSTLARMKVGEDTWERKPRPKRKACELSASRFDDLERYFIEWSIRTHFVEDSRFARNEVRGKLICAPDEEWDGEGDGDIQVGSITATQYRMHYMASNLNEFDVFDESDEGAEVYEAVVDGRFACMHMDEVLQGDLQVIERMEVHPAHRGLGLGLFMIEAADHVINGHCSAQVIKPFPLQFEQRNRRYGFPAPPQPTDRTHNAMFTAARDKLRAHYASLGFKVHRSTQYMLRWNGYQNPNLSDAMGIPHGHLCY